MKTAIGIAVFALSAATFSKQSAMYAYDLGSLNGGLCHPHAINDSGQITGNADGSDRIHGFITGPNGVGLTDIGTLSGNIWPVAINASGALAGYYIDISVPSLRAFTTSSNGANLRNLDLPDDSTDSSAYGINNAGQVVGSVDKVVDSQSVSYGFLTGVNGNGFTQLDTLGGAFSAALAINSAGQVAGQSNITGNAFTHAFITGPNGIGITDLGTNDGTGSFANAINDDGEVAGSITYSGGVRYHRQFVTGANGVGMINLGTLDNSRKAASSDATGINKKGTVVGRSTLNNKFGSAQATMTDKKNHLVNLNDMVVNLPVGVELVNAVAINASGQIAATGSDGHGYIVCPHENCAPN